MAKEVILLYEESVHAGFDDKAVAILSEGKVQNRPAVEEIQRLASKYTSLNGNRFDLITFRHFFQELEEMLRVPMTMLSTIFAFTHCSRLVIGPEVRENIFLSIGKVYRPGMSLTVNDWINVCRSCSWLVEEKVKGKIDVTSYKLGTGEVTDNFNSGVAQLVYFNASKLQFAEGGSSVRQIELSAVEKMAQSAVKSSDGRADPNREPATQKQLLETLQQFEFLLEDVAARKKQNPIILLIELKKAAQNALVTSDKLREMMKTRKVERTVSANKLEVSAAGLAAPSA
jgi:hypothetical protein